MCLFNPSTTMPISLRLLPLTSLISMQNCESHSKWFFSHIYHDKRTSDLTLLHWKQQRFSVKSRRTRKHNNFHTLRWGEGWKSGQEELETIDVRAERKRGSEEKKREWLTWIRLTRSFCCCTYITTPPPPSPYLHLCKNVFLVFTTYIIFNFNPIVAVATTPCCIVLYTAPI